MENIEHISSVLTAFINNSKLEYGLLKVRTQQAWEQIMSQSVLHSTSNVSLRGETLYIELKSSAVKQNLFYESQNIINKLNEILGKEVIRKIIFR